MKRFFQALLALGLFMAFAMPVEASWNIRQKGSGAAVWTDGKVEVPTGDSGLVVQMSDVTNISSGFVVSHKKGKLKKIYVVAQKAFTAGDAAPKLYFSIADGSTSYFQSISPGATITMTTNILGKADSVSPSDYRVDVAQGSVIAVTTDGAGASIIPATIIFVIE